MTCWLARVLVSAPIMSLAANASPPSEVGYDFQTDIYGVLARSCFECHGPEVQEAGLRLDQQSDLAESWVIDVDDLRASELVRRMDLPRGHDEVMPVVGEPLTSREVDRFRRWLDDGAPWPDGFVPPPHWAYVAPVRPLPPPVADPRWAAGPIDRFVQAARDQRALTPSPPADPAVWLRRVHLDLIGLPPTLEEIIAFETSCQIGGVIADRAKVAVVDDLMARPEFGQRWARPWLDLARYADSHGFQRDDLRDLWAYRDWVIDAMNADMPFDQFTIEQIAGDLLPETTRSQRIATGFHRCTPTNVEAGSLPEETRVEAVLDRVNTTASVWLGSTIECAQCHDHKFDPFSTEEYYRLFAFFNHTPLEADLKNPESVSSIGFTGSSITLPDPVRDDKRTTLQTRKRLLVQQRTRRQDELKAGFDQWVNAAQRRLADGPQSHPINITSFVSEGGTDSHQIRDDGAVLLVGNDPPARDRYEITGRVDTDLIEADEISAIRLDVLTDSSLPGGGPGRGDAKRTNFVLSEFSLFLPLDQNSKPVEFATATADFSQSGYDVAGAVDGDPKTGWAIAPQFGKSHHATFVLAKPISTKALAASATGSPTKALAASATGGGELRFVINHNFGAARTIGCFRLSAISGDVTAVSMPAAVAKRLAKLPERWTDRDREILADYQSETDSAMIRINDQITDLDQQLRQIAADTTQVMVEMDQPRSSYVFTRGDYRTAGSPVTPGVPAVLHPLDIDLSRDDSDNSARANRLDLARWLVDPANPLVARVTVNRWWAELFGIGLVGTPEDFGLKGDRPTHPHLLDFLADDFVRNDWSFKRTLRDIVLSSTYGQSSATTPEQLEADDPNRWLSRGPRFRMDAEMIRDNALAVAGLVNLRPGGPPIRPEQPDRLWAKVGGQSYDYVVSPGDEKYRRGVYVVIKRGSPYPSFINFDATNRFSCVVERSRSNTPLQSLTLLNDPVYVQSAWAIAIAAAGDARHQSIRSTIRQVFRRCVARQPAEPEVDALEALYEAQFQQFDQDPGRAETLVGDITVPDDIDAPAAAAWFSIGTVMLNLHETITKE